MTRCSQTAALLSAFLLSMGCQAYPESKYPAGHADSADATSSDSSTPADSGSTTTAPAAGEAGGTVTRRLSFPSGIDRAEGVYVVRRAPAQVGVGEEYEYVMKVVNASGGAAHKVVVTEHVPADGFQLVSAKPETALKDGLLTWDIGNMEKGESREIVVRGRVTKAVEDLGDCAWLTWEPHACLHTKVVTPKLALTKDETEKWQVNKPFVITYVAKNDGTGTVRDAVLTDTLAEGLTLVEGGGNKVESKLGDIKPGESKKVEVQVQAAKPGKYESPATVTGSGLTAQATDATLIQAAHLKVEKVGPATSFIGVKTTYKIKVTNDGDIVAHHVVVKDAIPEGLAYVSSAPEGSFGANTVTWEIPELGAGEAKEMTVSLSPVRIGDFVNVADAKSDETQDEKSEGAKTAVAPVAGVVFNVSDDHDPVQVGDEVTYTITATNQGDSPVSNVTPSCLLDFNEEYVSAEGGDEGKPTVAKFNDAEYPADANKTNVILPMIKTLGSKASATWKVKVKGTGDGEQTFKVRLFVKELKRTPQKNEITTFFGGGALK